MILQLRDLTYYFAFLKRITRALYVMLKWLETKLFKEKKPMNILRP